MAEWLRRWLQQWAAKGVSKIMGSPVYRDYGMDCVRNYIQVKQRSVITQTCPNFNGKFAQLNLGHG